MEDAFTMSGDCAAWKSEGVVATGSAAAALLLVALKLVAGLVSGSLEVLFEAMHSGMDLAAAVVAFFAVRVAGKPVDPDHHYGHGKPSQP